MGQFFVVLILLSPVVLAAGLIKPALFAKIFGKVPTRLAIAKLSGALFVGSFFGAGFTLPPVEPTEDNVELSTEPDTVAPTPSEEVPTQEKAEPKTEDITPTEEPQVQVPPEEPIQEYTQPSEPTYTPEPEYEAPEPTPTPAPSTPTYNCSSNSYNCSDFSTWSQAQAVYNYCLDTVGRDVHDLDRDDDGSACDDLQN